MLTKKVEHVIEAKARIHDFLLESPEFEACSFTALAPFICPPSTNWVHGGNAWV